MTWFVCLHGLEDVIVVSTLTQLLVVIRSMWRKQGTQKPWLARNNFSRQQTYSQSLFSLLVLKKSRLLYCEAARPTASMTTTASL